MRPRRRCSCDRPHLPRRRARVGDLCGFPDTAERVPAKYQKTGRCASVQERCESGKHRRKSPADGFRRRKKPQAARQEKRLGAFLRQPVHFCPQCGQFRAVKTALFCEGEKWIGADFRKKPRSCRCCRHYFGAFHFGGGERHKNRGKTPSFRVAG